MRVIYFLRPFALVMFLLSVFCSSFIIHFINNITIIFFLDVICVLPVVFSSITVLIPGEGLLSASPSAAVASLSALARLHACISPSRTTCIMVPFSHSTEAIAVLYFTSHFVKYVITVILQEN